MQILYLLIPLSLIFITAAVIIFRWAVNNAQFDDLEGPAHRVILDDRELLRSNADARLSHANEAAIAGETAAKAPKP